MKYRTALFGIATVGILTFFLWAVSVLIPVAFVELRYQYQLMLRNAFHVTDIRGLILPQFRLDLRGFTSRHTTNGITIPAINVDEPVIFNVDPNDSKAYTSALKHGIAHASSTAFPGTGGLGYYFAHSSTPAFITQFNAVFYLLGKLKPGDEVYIWHENKRTDYSVTRSAITDPNDVSFLHDMYDAETIVLQTCWPPGTTLRRFLVFATRIPKK
ncbi:sortase [Candidatus Gottesmanbacteria bacterium]|nr:sortase [Candidatus Gottesmanbacteria bacterium]